jgi:hypothetical protein
MTVMLWVRKASLQSGQYCSLVGRRFGSGGPDLWNLFYNNDANAAYSFILRTSSGEKAVYGPSSRDESSDTLWVHLAAVYNGSQIILYKNGQAVASSAHSGTLGQDSTPLIIGAGDNGQVSEYTDGSIDEVRLYNSALSQEQIQSVMNSGLVRITFTGGSSQRYRNVELPFSLDIGATVEGGSGGVPSVSWSVANKPAGASVNFSAPAALSTKAEFSQSGDYVLRLSTTSGAAASADLSISVNPPNDPPLVDVGRDLRPWLSSPFLV